MGQMSLNLFLGTYIFKFTPSQFLGLFLNGAGRDSFVLHTSSVSGPHQSERKLPRCLLPTSELQFAVPSAFPFMPRASHGRNGMLGLTALNALSGDLDFWCSIWDIIALKGAAFLFHIVDLQIKESAVFNFSSQSQGRFVKSC